MVRSRAGVAVASASNQTMPFAIVAAVFLSSYLTWRPSTDIMFTLSDALFLIGIAQLAFRSALPLEPFGALTAYWLAGFAMLIGGLGIGSIACLDPIRWLVVSGQYLFAWIVLPIVLLRRSPAQLTVMLKAFVWGVFFMNLFGIAIYFGYSGSFQQAQATFGEGMLSGSRRLGAFASDANWNGAALAMAVPSVIYLRAKQYVGNLLTICWLPVLLLGIVLSASFSAFMSCATGIAIFVLIGGIRPPPRILLVAVAVATFFALALAQNLVSLPSVFIERVGNALENGDISEAGTFVGRMQLIREAWTLVEQHMLIGMGADQYRVVSIYKAPVHNLYLLLWAEGGLISLAGWLLMMGALIAVSLKVRARDRLAAALTLSVTATFLFSSTASPHMYARFWSVPVILALAASLALFETRGDVRRRLPKHAEALA